MAELTVTASLRQGLNPRQAETVERLLVAGEAELDEAGPEALTIRTVAQRAGVSPATAYTYLASKHHLFAVLFWRRIVTDPGPAPTGATATERIQAFTRHMAAMLGRSPSDPLVLMIARGPAGYRFAIKALQHAIPDARVEVETIEGELGTRMVPLRLSGLRARMR